MSQESNNHTEKNVIVMQASSRSEIPENAVFLTAEEAASIRLEQVYKWRPKLDMWAVRYGPFILGAAAAVPSLYINSFFRRKLKLRNKGVYTMYSGLFYGPSLMAAFGHYQFITLPLATLNENQCPLCLEMRASLIQCFLTTIYPTMLAGASGLMFATRHATVDLPYYKDVKGMFMHFWNMSKVLWRPLGIIVIAETVFTNFITYMEAKQIFGLTEKLLKEYENLRME